MSGLKGRERLQPALLDRLTDNAPGQSREGPDDQAITMAQLRQAVLRDLAFLLNTTNLTTLEDLADAPLAEKSTLNYGIPGIAGMTENASRINALERELADAIRTYEPRIHPDTLRVRLSDGKGGGANPSLVFEIEGELWAQPLPVHLFLETSIDVETRHAIVTEAKATP
jgi:type VI secretion system protein ImpF